MPKAGGRIYCVITGIVHFLLMGSLIRLDPISL